MKFDKDLATRVINLTGKEITEAMTAEDPAKVREHLQKALSRLTFLPDVLHFYEDEIEKKEIDVIDPYRI